MTPALVLLMLAAPCDLKDVGQLDPQQQQALCALAEAPAPHAEADPRALAAIYARPGFEQARQRNSGALAALLAQLRAWLDELLGTRGAETYSNVTRMVVLGLALLLTLGLALRVLRRGEAVTPTMTAEPARDTLILDDPRLHRERARALLATNPREALREGLLSLLATLERRHWLRPDRTKTNREIALEVPQRGAPASVTAALTPLLGRYDRAFYSLEVVSADEAQGFLDEVDRLLGAEGVT